MKPVALQPREGVFNFSDADRLIAFAKEHDMSVRGHTLVWHAQTPDWFFTDLDGNRIDEKDVITEEDRQLVIDRMEAHIEGVMNHFGDSVYAWDVVNEAISDDGNIFSGKILLGIRFLEMSLLKLLLEKLMK